MNTLIVSGGEINLDFLNKYYILYIFCLVRQLLYTAGDIWN